MQIVLASQSPNRKRLLSKTGFIFKVFHPDIQEEKFIDPKKPENSCLYIAEQKAVKGQSIYKTAVIIACDQMAYCEGKLFGKAYTEEKAIQTLTELQGKSHELLTGLYMLLEDKKHSYLCKSKMTMRALSPQQIKNYVLREKPLQCAGSYHVESQGLNLFKKIETEDFNSIEGLPLIHIVNQLEQWGCPLFVD